MIGLLIELACSVFRRCFSNVFNIAIDIAGLPSESYKHIRGLHIHEHRRLPNKCPFLFLNLLILHYCDKEFDIQMHKNIRRVTTNPKDLV